MKLGHFDVAVTVIIENIYHTDQYQEFQLSINITLMNSWYSKNTQNQTV